MLYLHKKGPMGGAPYIGPRPGNGLTFEVSVSQLELPDKLPITHGIFIILIVAMAAIDFSLIFNIESKGGQL